MDKEAMDEEPLGREWGYTRVNWRTPVLTAVSSVAVVGLSIAFLDRPIATYSHDVIHHPEWAKLLTKLAILPDPLALAALAVVTVLYFWRGRLSFGGRTAAAAALATLLATMAVIILKIAFGRLWPETWLVPPNPSWINTHQYGFQPFHSGIGYESFPSGHTTRITAPFAVLWRRLPRYRVLWVLPTLLVMVGLLASDFHFLGDCLAGIYLGIASAAVILLVM
jgi:membrane-associated phospholipid phosphatase